MKHCPQCSTGYPDSQTTCPTHGLPLNEIRDLKPGMVVHHSYRILRKLGQGGMGSVYLAQHTLMDEPRALKFLSPELSSDQAFTSRFLREVRTLRQIRNRNVVDCGDLERAEDDSLFFSMEFVDGPDLRRFLHDAPQPFDVPLALEIARGIAEGLGAAHAKGMVHRDIKPENILMARDGDAWLPKIADFGIVATKESSSIYTRTGGTLLTMTYAAPEQWRGTAAAELDGRTDLYALGGLLYEMLTGQTAFHAENYEGWSWQHQNTPPRTRPLAGPRLPRPPPAGQKPRRPPQRRCRTAWADRCCALSTTRSAPRYRCGVCREPNRWKTQEASFSLGLGCIRSRNPDGGAGHVARLAFHETAASTGDVTGGS